METGDKQPNNNKRKLVGPASATTLEKIQPELIIRSTEVDYYDLQKIDYDNQQLIKIYTYNYDLQLII